MTYVKELATRVLVNHYKNNLSIIKNINAIDVYYIVLEHDNNGAIKEALCLYTDLSGLVPGTNHVNIKRPGKKLSRVLMYLAQASLPYLRKDSAERRLVELEKTRNTTRIYL